MNLSREDLDPIRESAFVMKKDSLSSLERLYRAANPFDDACSFESQKVLVLRNNTH